MSPRARREVLAVAAEGPASDDVGDVGDVDSVDPRVVDPTASDQEEDLEEVGLRPRSLSEFVGQAQLVEHLSIVLEAARQRHQAVDHILFAGPPGLGKTSLAGIVAAEMRAGLRITAGPVLTRAGDLAALLTAMGAKIEGAGTSTIRVQGVTRLYGARYRINPDRIEAGTFLVAGAITSGDLIVANCNASHLGAIIAKLQETGARVDTLGPDTVRVRSDGQLRAADISTEEYPGFPTDMQAQYMALATQADGVSQIKENIFENRFMHVQELVRMGANIKVDGNTATVRGAAKLSAAAVMCSDLRASASLVLAALVADGESILDRVYHMDRGYERFEEKLRSVGAQIRRMGNVFNTKEVESAAD